MIDKGEPGLVLNVSNLQDFMFNPSLYQHLMKIIKWKKTGEIIKCQLALTYKDGYSLLNITIYQWSKRLEDYHCIMNEKIELSIYDTNILLSLSEKL